jgi:nucleoside-diphosphate-sugar epimerase
METNMAATTRTALVLGATGGVGGETARALIAKGWGVKALARRSINDGSPIQWLQGDALNARDVLQAAEGVSAIVHAVNPPGYRHWETQVLPMMDNTIAAARATGARIALPGTVYNYGPDVFPLIAEDDAQHPVTRKGEIRVALERRMEDAARDGVRSVILRCGDFYGPRAGNTWMAQGIIKPGKPLQSIAYPGPRNLPHAWAYLPDVGATMAALLDSDERLPTFARFHFAGDVVTGEMLADAIRDIARKPELPLRAFPWWLATLASPFVETMREVRKMRYLWETELVLDGRRLRQFLPDVTPTPFPTALRTTLEGLGVLDSAKR